MRDISVFNKQTASPLVKQYAWDLLICFIVYCVGACWEKGFAFKPHLKNLAFKFSASGLSL